MSAPQSQPQPGAASSRRQSGCFKWLALVCIVTTLVAGVLAWRFVDTIAGAVRGGIGWVAELPSKMTSRQITETFRESVTRIAATQGDVLEVATLETDETLTKTDVKTVFDLVYLGTTVSEIRAPVVYRYHIRLSDEWQVRIQEGRCIVVAPAIRPSLPPAVRTDGMEKRSEAGWLRFNAAENLAVLEKNLTPTLERRAGTPGRITLVRESARQAVAEFVKKWLLKDAVAGAASVRSLVILFPEEKSRLAQPLVLPPTLELEVP